MHDETTGLIYNRARFRNHDRFLQRDPLGYPDGMNAYAEYHVLHGDYDPLGLLLYYPEAGAGDDVLDLDGRTGEVMERINNMCPQANVMIEGNGQIIITNSDDVCKCEDEEQEDGNQGNNHPQGCDVVCTLTSSEHRNYIDTSVADPSYDNPVLHPEADVVGRKNLANITKPGVGSGVTIRVPTSHSVITNGYLDEEENVHKYNEQGLWNHEFAHAYLMNEGRHPHHNTGRTQHGVTIKIENTMAKEQGLNYQRPINTKDNPDLGESVWRYNDFPEDEWNRYWGPNRSHPTTEGIKQRGGNN